MLNIQPGVRVNPTKRTNPAVTEVIDKIKLTIRTFGYCTSAEFVYFAKEHSVSEELLLEALRSTGFGFVKTPIDDPQRPEEVIVDLRPLAATMLLIYSDKDYAHSHSVLHYVKTLYVNGRWEGARVTWGHHTLLEDTYGTYGHFFTVMSVADAVDLTNASEKLAVERAWRHVHAVNELCKNEYELTAVYLLTMHLMHAINTMGAASDPSAFDAVRHRRHLSGEKRLAYEHFWRMANKIINNMRGPQRPKKQITIRKETS